MIVVFGDWGFLVRQTGGSRDSGENNDAAQAVGRGHAGGDDMERYTQFRTQPRKLPAVLSVEEDSELLLVAPALGRKYRDALSILMAQT